MALFKSVVTELLTLYRQHSQAANEFSWPGFCRRELRRSCLNKVTWPRRLGGAVWRRMQTDADWETAARPTSGWRQARSTTHIGTVQWTLTTTTTRWRFLTWMKSDWAQWGRDRMSDSLVCRSHTILQSADHTHVSVLVVQIKQELSFRRLLQPPQKCQQNSFSFWIIFLPFSAKLTKKVPQVLRNYF